MSTRVHDGPRGALLARRLLQANAATLDAVLQSTIDEAVDMAGADRGLILLGALGDLEVLAASDWDRTDLRSWLAKSLEDRARELPMIVERWRRGEVVKISRPEDLPPDAASEREALAHYGIRSLLVIPLASTESVIGFLLFECTRDQRDWSDEEIGELRHLGEVLAIAIDRRRSDQALRESEARFRALTEHATELIAELDSQGNYLYVSPSSRHLLGYDPQELLGKNSSSIVHTDDLRDSAELLLRAFALDGESHVVHRVRHKDGGWRWFDNTGRTFCTPSGDRRFVSVGRDITTKREVEEAFARRLSIEGHVAAVSRRFLDVQSEGVGDAIRGALAETGRLIGADSGFLISYVVDAPAKPDVFEWNVSGVADVAREWLPWASPKAVSGEVVHIPSLDSLPPEASTERDLYAAEGIRSLIGVPLRSNERLVGYLCFRRTHEERAYSNEEITALGVIGQIFVSALHRRQAEEELRVSNVELVQAQKIEAVGRLAGGIAHDFNNLLTVILGFAAPLLQEVAEDDPKRADIQQICGAAQRAATLTRQLLAFSRRQEIATQAVDLNRVVSDLGDMLRRLLEEDVDLDFDLCDELCVVEGDPNQIEQVMINLALNARDAMPGGGRLRIRTMRTRFERAARRRLGLGADCDYAVLEVCDTGCGMSDEVKAHLFEPFFTTKEQGKGTGLGLSIAYGVVRQTGGAIEVESKPGYGSIFRVCLPCTEARVEVPLESERAGVLTGSETILLAEDEPAVRILVRRLLERAGYTVIDAENGQAALERAEGRPDVRALVTDVVMPRMGGIELARQMRRKRPGIPVLYLSGYPEDQRAHGDAGPPRGAFLRKPFGSNQLLARLRELLDAQG